MRDDTEVSSGLSPMRRQVSVYVHRTHTYTLYLRNISPLKIKTRGSAFSGLENRYLKQSPALAFPVPDHRASLCWPH